jgi:hypothetical protein
MSDEKMKFTELTIEERTKVIENARLRAEQKLITKATPIINVILEQLEKDLEDFITGESIPIVRQFEFNYEWREMACLSDFILKKLRERINPVQIKIYLRDTSSLFKRKCTVLTYIKL